jgi:putative flippase GtrA
LAQILSLAHENRKEFVRFFKFMVVGTIGAMVDFGILNGLMLTLRAQHVDLGTWHLFGGLTLNGNLTLSNTISFTSAVISNFIWNRLWTYPESRSKPLTGQLGQFFIVNIAGLAINLAVLNALDPFFTGLLGPLGYNAAKAIATIVVMFWNFFVNRFWTYNDVKLGQ